MTRLTSITEFTEEDKAVFMGSNTDGFKAKAVFENDECIIHYTHPSGETWEEPIHPDDAKAEVLAFLDLY